MILLKITANLDEYLLYPFLTSYIMNLFQITDKYTTYH